MNKSYDITLNLKIACAPPIRLPNCAVHQPGRFVSRSCRNNTILSRFWLWLAHGSITMAKGRKKRCHLTSQHVHQRSGSEVVWPLTLAAAFASTLDSAVLPTNMNIFMICMYFYSALWWCTVCSRSFQTGRNSYSSFGLWRTANSSASPQWPQHSQDHLRCLYFVMPF